MSKFWFIWPLICNRPVASPSFPYHVTKKRRALGTRMVGLHEFSRPYGACVKRASEKHMFGLSFFRPSRQSKISTSGEERFKYPIPWEDKISQMPHHRANKDNQIPTPCPASPPHPCRHNIDKTVKGLNPGVISKVVWVWSSGWT